MKFRRNISYSLQAIELRGFCDGQADRSKEENNMSHNLPGVGGDIITALNLHNYEMLNKMTNSTYGNNVLDKHNHITSLWYFVCPRVIKCTLLAGALLLFKMKWASA